MYRNILSACVSPLLCPEGNLGNPLLTTSSPENRLSTIVYAGDISMILHTIINVQIILYGDSYS